MPRSDTADKRAPHGDARISRRGLLTGVGIALIAGRRPVLAQTPIRFGLTPVFLNNDLELLSKLKAYLERATGYPVQLVTRRTYQEITSLLVSGQLEAAWICGYPYVQYRDQLSLVAVPVWHGKPLYQSYLIVKEDRLVNAAEDLRGDIHAFSDPNSNSGFLVTRALLADWGETPDSFFRTSIYTYGHRNVIRAVASGLADSGSVDGYVWEVVRDVEPELAGATRIVRRSEWLGFPPIATPARLAGAPEVRAIAQALAGMQGDPIGQDVLDMLRLDGFEATGPELFDPIAAMYDKIRSAG